MSRLLALLLLAGLAAGQGRDSGNDGDAVIFVRWFATTESDAIHRVAWRALEPYSVSRRRIATFHRDKKKATAYLTANKDAKVIVAYDKDVAAFVRKLLPDAAVLEVHENKTAHVLARTNQKRFLTVMRYIEPDLPWIRAGDAIPKKPVACVSTTALLEDGRAVITMRPDPRSIGLHAAAQLLEFIRKKRAFRRVTVQRMRLTVDLRAAKRAGIAIPMALLAKADVVRRGR